VGITTDERMLGSKEGECSKKASYFYLQQSSKQKNSNISRLIRAWGGLPPPFINAYTPQSIRDYEDFI